jgi:hypothetical protein
MRQSRPIILVLCILLAVVGYFVLSEGRSQPNGPPAEAPTGAP